VARFVFLLLVFANLVVFVWNAGYLGGGEDGREPERLRQQLDADRLKVSRGDTPPVAAAEACRRIGPLAGADAETLGKTIVTQGGSVSSAPADEPSYWVYIPAVSGQPADGDIAALKKAGFKEFSLVAEQGPDLNAISLGTFAKEESAKEKVARLLKNGIKSARIANRTKSAGQVVLTARGMPEVLDKILTGQTAEPVDCPKE
jgi:hypothetical protein